jgi:ADP-ribose pyrophosphatase YjhB (NUDIX family)
MRRSRRLRLADVPRLIVGGAVGFAGLFGGRYGRIEGAHVLATDAERRILVVRTTYLGPGWMLPGGRVERGETPHAAAVRETLEETGLHARIERLVLVDAHRASDVSFVFRGRVEGGELQPQFGEIAEAGWVGRDEIARTSPRLHRLLELIEDSGGGVAYLGIRKAR